MDIFHPIPVLKAQKVHLCQLVGRLRKHSVFYAFLGTLRHRNKIRFDETLIEKGERNRNLAGMEHAIDVLNRYFSYTEAKGLKTVFVLEFFRDPVIKQRFLEYLSKKTHYIIDLDTLAKSDSFYLPRDGHWSSTGSRSIGASAGHNPTTFLDHHRATGRRRVCKADGLGPAGRLEDVIRR